MFSAHNPRAAAAYQRIHVETTAHTPDQHQIVGLLFDGFLSSLAAARGAMARGDVAGKCAAVSKALRILEEGLMTGLDPVDGGELAANLEALYSYASRQLILANARNDDALFQQVHALIEPIARSWMAISPAATAQAANKGLTQNPPAQAPAARLAMAGA